MKTQKILFGVTGIGLGHSCRQMPLIDYFSKNSTVVIFAYESSFDFLALRFGKNKNIKIKKVAVPFYVGNKDGLDFKATMIHPANKNINFLDINSRTISETVNLIGSPDLVISDYEPISAQYAYMKNSPFVTIDQQSKYFVANFPKSLNVFTYKDEIERLSMFFPKADLRIACSFFNIKKKKSRFDVQIVPPVMRESIINMKKIKEKDRKNILVYISSARDFPLSTHKILTTLGAIFDINFYIFLSRSDRKIKYKSCPENISLINFGEEGFEEVLKKANGIITSAGHSLLSEAMFLGIPVYVIPVSPYEQHMNAKVIDENEFGVSEKTISESKVNYFINNLDKFEENILKDKKQLLKGIGQDKILALLRENFGIK